MTERVYFADIVAHDGRVDPATAVLVSGVSWRAIDARAVGGAAPGRMMVIVDVTPAQHATLVADARVTYLPFEDAGGTPLPFSGPISGIPLAKRNTISAAAETMHVPLQGITLSDPIRFFLWRIRIRLLMRQYLGSSLDLTEGLDTLISAIAPARRQAINDRLTQAGFSSRDAGVLPTDTVRAAIVKMVLEREEKDRG